MTQHLKTFLKLSIILGVCAAFLWAAFRDVDLGHFWREIQRAKPVWFIPTISLIILSNLPRAWRWRILMAPITRDISLWRTFVAVLIGYAGNNIFPRAGEVARVVAVKQGRDLPISSLLATVLVERVLDLFTLLLLFGVILFAFRTEISRVFPWMESVGLAAFLASLLLMVLFGLLSAYGDRALGILERILGRLSQSLASRATEILRAFFQGMDAIRTTAGYAEIIASTLLLNAIYVLTAYLPFLAFGFPERYGLDLAAALVVTVISTIGIILPSFGGIGTYHYFCGQTLHRLYGVPIDEAVAFATVFHGIVYLTFLIAGGPGLLALFVHRRRPLAAGSRD